MIRLLQLIFLGHSHKWKTNSVHDILDMTFEGKPGVVGRVYYQSCEKCGTVRRKKLS